MNLNLVTSNDNTEENKNDSKFKFKFGKITLNVGVNNCEDCGSNGLPITPNSISIIGTFQSSISSISHSNLVQYLDCYRTKNGNFRLLLQSDPLVDRVFIFQKKSALFLNTMIILLMTI